METIVFYIDAFWTCGSNSCRVEIKFAMLYTETAVHFRCEWASPALYSSTVTAHVPGNQTITAK